MYSYFEADADLARADVALLGVPLDDTTCFRPGTRGGPRAIRAMAENLEDYSVGLQAHFPHERFCDLGDVALSFGNATQSLARIEEAVWPILQADKLPVVLGGEHLLTVGLIRALARRHPDACLLQIDAHFDLRTDYLGEPLSHATAMRRCREALEMGEGDRPARLVQIGVRSGTAEEAAYAREHVPQVQPTGDPARLVDALDDLSERWSGRPVWVSFDIDGVDPAFAPGTGTPEPGGLTSREALALVQALPSRFRLVGFDLVECNPRLDPSEITAALGAKLVRELIIAHDLAHPRRESR